MEIQYLKLALGIKIAHFLFQTYVDCRQYSKFKQQQRPSGLPPQISDQEFHKSQKYNTAKMQFGIFKGMIDVALSVLLLSTGVIAWMWSQAVVMAASPDNILTKIHGMSESNSIRGLYFMGLSTNLDYVLGLPFKIYKTFKIEQEFGFNKSTFSLFIRDQMIGITLTMVIGGIILYLLLELIQWGGESFVFYVTFFFILVILVMSTIYPNLIQPLFNKFEQLKDGSLKDKIYNKAKELSYPLTKIYVCDASKRSAHSNAYMYGFWWNKRIVLFDTLVNQCDEDEILAVMTHEFGHWKFGHTLIGIAISLANITVIFYLFSFTLNRKDLLDSFLFSQYYDAQGRLSIMLCLYVFLELYTPINFATQFLFTYLTRRMEYQADEFAKAQGFRELLKNALIKLFVENSGNMNPDPLYATVNFSHPTLTERIHALDKAKEA